MLIITTLTQQQIDEIIPMYGKIPCVDIAKMYGVNNELEFAAYTLGINLWRDYFDDRLNKTEDGNGYLVPMTNNQIKAVCLILERYRNANPKPVRTDD